MKRIFFLLMIGIASQAGAAEYRSSFGFSFELPEDWLVLTPAEVAKHYRNETPESLAIDGDQATAQGILDQVRRGEIEFYFDRKHSTKDFKNNISVQRMQGSQTYTETAVAELCRSLAEELPKVFGSKIDIASCGSAEMHGIRFMAFEYFLPAQQVHVVQYEIPFVADSTLLLVGGAHREGLERLKSAEAAIADRINSFTRERMERTRH